MSNDACVAFCDGRGFPVAGTEYAGQCFCGTEISSAQLDESACNMECTGEADDLCGGPGALSVWSKVSGSKKMAKRHLGHISRHGRKLIDY